MSRVLLVHRGEVAVERDVVDGLAARLRGLDHELRCTWEQRGVTGGWLAALEAGVDWADRVLLVNPHRWWPQRSWRREPASDEWQRSLHALVEQALSAEIDRFGVAITGTAWALEPLARLPSFAVDGGWAGLDEWLARPRAKLVLLASERIPPRSLRFVANEPAFAAIDEAVGAAERRGGDLVWIRGATGTGKTALLIEWLHRRAPSELQPICHFARAGIPWSHDPEQVLAKLGAIGERAIVVVDGLEQIVARLRTLAPELRDRFRRVLAGEWPGNVTVVATSRALPPGELAREPNIDLDGEPWRERQREQAQRLIRDGFLGGQAWLSLLAEQADGNLGLAAALVEAHAERGQSDPPGVLELPASFTSVLERSWTAMLARAGALRSALCSGLAILMAVREAPTVALFEAALSEAERELVRVEASEWLREANGRVEFVHPFVRRFLEVELDVTDPAPHVRLLDSLASLGARGAMDASTRAYASKHARAHRLACHGFDTGLAWITDVELLVSLAERDLLVSRLEAALELADPQRRELVELTLAVARRRRAEFADGAASLPSHLWTELVGSGIRAAKLVDLLDWGTMLPPVRLSNEMGYRERSYLRLVHEGEVRGCAIDAEAKRAISVTTDRRMHVWSVRTGERLAKLDIEAWAEGCAISADGKRAAVAAGRRVSLWDLDANVEIARHEDHGVDLTTVSMSEDGLTIVSADRDGIVRLWQVARERRNQLGRHGAIVRCSAISGDGRLALTGDDERRVRVWDLGRREGIQTLPGHTYGVGGVALTQTGELGVSICIGEARVWDPRSGQLLAMHDDKGMSTHGCVLVASATRGQGQGWEVVVGESGQDLNRWTVADGKLRVRHLAHAQDMTCVAATPDGEWYMTGGQDRVARVWQTSAVTGIDDYPMNRAITAMCASADESSIWISGGGEGTRCVSIVDGRELARIERSGVHAMVEAGDYVVTGGSDRRIEVHSRSRRDSTAGWESSKDWIRACAVDPTHSRLAYAGDEKIVFCSDFQGGELVRLDGHGDWIRDLAFLSDGRLVSVDDDGQLRIWDVSAKACVLQCQPLGDSAIYALAIAEQRAFVGGTLGKIASVDLRSGETLATFEAHRSPIADIAVAGPDTLVTISRDATLGIWEVDGASSRLLSRYEGVYPFTRVVVVGRTIVAGDAAGNHLVLTVDWARLRQG